jgi:hypothetical protein
VRQEGSEIDQERRATVEFVAMVQSDQGSMLNQTKAMALEDIRVV